MRPESCDESGASSFEHDTTQVSAGQGAAGQASAGQVSAGQVSAGQVSAGQGAAGPEVEPPTQVFGARNALDDSRNQKGFSHDFQPREPLALGEVVAGRFEIQALAGAGGMGVVYRAHDRQFGATVALKILSGDAGNPVRFMREAEVLSELAHPAIVRYLAHGQAGQGLYFLAMEWLEGHDLSRQLSKQPLTVRQTLELGRRAAGALAIAHARKIVHRDINPRNLFLVDGRPDRTKVLDFGIARLHGPTHHLTTAGVPLGTPGYMSPEQAQCVREITARADVFSLGCVLFECLTGQRPFMGQTLMELFAKILLDEVPPVGAFNREVPIELERLIAAMLQKDPSFRPDHAGQVLEELEAIDLPEASEAVESVPVSSVGVTATEQRLLCVILATGPNIEAALESIGAASKQFGAPAHLMADGSLIVCINSLGSATDQVAQAARCALMIRKQLPSAVMALTTGRAVTTGRVPVGEAIERASSFLRRASENEPANSVAERPICIDDVTAGLLDARFDVHGGESGLTLRGMRGSVEPTRTVLGRPTQCVGRQRELGLLQTTFGECEEEGVAHVVLVTGEPGIGKSRLAHEFMHKLRRAEAPPEIWLGRGDNMGIGAPFAILGQAIRRAAGISEGEPLPVRRHKLLARVGRHVRGSDVQRIAEFLGELIGTCFPEENSPQLRAARQNPVLRGDQMLRAFEDFLVAETSQKPLVIVLDDLHWGDLPTVRFIDSVLRNLSERPLMVLALGRSEVHSRFPNLWEHRGVFELRLAGLGRRAAEKIVREVLGQEADAQVVERVVSRAGGNPLWLEELLRAEAEGRGAELPLAVVLLAQSRLEQLDASARRVLRAGSILGQNFWRAAIDSLFGDEPSGELDAILVGLQEQEVILCRNVGRFPGTKEYEFTSGLFRDAAYASLTEEDRRNGHRLAARWLSEAGESDALTLALHFEHGGENEQAISWYRKASVQALEGNDWEFAVARAERGLSLGARGEIAAALRLVQSEASKWSGKNVEAQRYGIEAMRLSSSGCALWCAAAGEAAAASGKLGDKIQYEGLSRSLLDTELSAENDPALIIALSRTATQLTLVGEQELSDRLLARINGLSDAVNPEPQVMGWVFEARAVRAAAADDPASRVKLAEIAAEQFEEAGDLRNACLQRISAGFGSVEIGSYRAAEQILREALNIGERMGLSNSIPIAKAQLGRALCRLGAQAEARRLFEEAIYALDEQGNPRLSGSARTYLAALLLESGENAAAEQYASEAVEILNFAQSLQPAARAVLANTYLSQKRASEALAEAKKAFEGLGSGRTSNIGDVAIRLSYVEALTANAEHALAKQELSEACRRLMARAERIADVQRRKAFLSKIPEHRRLLELAGISGFEPTSSNPH